MKSAYSKATFYRNIQKRTASCLTLSQDDFFDNNERDVLLASNINKKPALDATAEKDIEYVDDAIAENLEYIDDKNESYSSINVEYFDNVHDSSSQSCGNSDVSNSNIPIGVERTIIKDNV